MTGAVVTTTSRDQACAEKLLRIARIDGPFELHPQEGGRNNRATRITTRSADYFHKQYADNAADRRDRLKSETAFYRYAHELGISTVPTLLAADRTTRSTLFTFVQGTKMTPELIDRDAIHQAAAFVLALNRDRQRGTRLPDASEAGFSLDNHYRSVQQRLDTLSRHATHPAAAEFLQQELRPQLRSHGHGLRDTRPLAAAERCISPSDFGFHNTIRMSDGRLCFIDFEYAGWDDPARLICDFFLQIAVPVPCCFLPAMVEKLAPLFGSPTWLAERVARLMPLYHLKWCCLLLSDLHPDTRFRRQFAGLNIDAGYLERQLARALARYRDRAPIEAARALVEELP